MTGPQTAPSDESPFASRREVARYLNVSDNTLAVWAHRGTGPPCIRMNGSPRYRWDELHAWIADRDRVGGDAA